MDLVFKKYSEFLGEPLQIWKMHKLTFLRDNNLLQNKFKMRILKTILLSRSACHTLGILNSIFAPETDFQIVKHLFMIFAHYI